MDRGSGCGHVAPCAAGLLLRNTGPSGGGLWCNPLAEDSPLVAREPRRMLGLPTADMAACGTGLSAAGCKWVRGGCIHAVLLYPLQ